MIKHVIKKHNAMPSPQLIDLAKEQGVQLVACTMTMDLLGIKEEEEAALGGVAAFISFAIPAEKRIGGANIEGPRLLACR